MPASAALPRIVRRNGLRLAVYGCAAGLVLAASAEAYHVLLGENLHAVLPGRAYRCAQLTGPEFEKAIRAYGIRTVVNLRGCCAPYAWYLDECRVAGRLGVSHEDVCMSAGRYPPTHELRRLVEIFDRTAYPILLHCRQGADRTGLASAVLVLLQPGGTLAEARRQMSLRYGHIAVGRPANLDRYLGLYEGWLRDRARPHSPEAFRAWLAADTCPGEDCCTLELLDVPARVAASDPFGVRVRARNTGCVPWRFHTGTTAGVHLFYSVLDTDEKTLYSSRAGLFDAEVPPGQGIELTLAVPPLGRPGRYRLHADMIDEAQGFFFQVNAEPLEREIVVGQ